MGDAFAPSAVGRVSGGCNPRPVEAFETDDTRVVVSEATLAAAAPMFKNWKGAQ
ncbi:MAG: Fe-S-containing protein [Clostridiales bacterium]|nr:Fe-S-containing protein [Clostridiales bacterium]MDY5514556.1 Fe-S-containing protein [Candidatus Ventricola sp.]